MSGYEAPAGWKTYKLASLAAPEPHSMTDGPFGSKLKSEHYTDDGEVRVVRLGNIGVGAFVDKVKAFVPTERLEDLGKHQVYEGDLVIAALAEPVGRACQMPNGLGPAIVKADCIRLKVKPGVEPRFVMHWLNSPEGLAQSLESAHGVGRVRMNMQEMRALDVPVPDLQEQRRIVERIDDLLGRARRAREALADVPRLLDRLRQSILAAAFRGDLTAAWREAHPDVEPASVLLERVRDERRRRWEAANPRKKYVEPEPVDPEAEGLPELPVGWAWSTLEALTDACRPVQYGILKPGPDNEGGVPYVKVRNMKGHIIDVAGLCRTTPEIHAQYARSALGRGDLLISIRGSYGSVALVPDELDGANITQDSARIGPLPGIDRHFLRYMLLSPPTQTYFDGVVTGMAIRGVNIGDLRPTRLPVAPVEEQTEVASQVSAAMEVLERQSAAAARLSNDLATFERSSLSMAFRGELLLGNEASP